MGVDAKRSRDFASSLSAGSRTGTWQIGRRVAANGSASCLSLAVVGASKLAAIKVTCLAGNVPDKQTGPTSDLNELTFGATSLVGAGANGALLGEVTRSLELSGRHEDTASFRGGDGTRRIGHKGAMPDGTQLEVSGKASGLANDLHRIGRVGGNAELILSLILLALLAAIGVDTASVP